MVSFGRSAVLRAGEVGPPTTGGHPTGAEHGAVPERLEAVVYSSPTAFGFTGTPRPTTLRGVEVLFDAHGMTIVRGEDGLLRTSISGAQDMAPDQVDSVFDQIRALMKDNAPVRHLLDGRGLTVNNMALRWKLAQNMRRQREYIFKSAIVHESATFRTIAGVVVRTSGRDNVQFFPTVEAAEAWLRSDDA